MPLKRRPGLNGWYLTVKTRQEKGGGRMHQRASPKAWQCSLKSAARRWLCSLKSVPKRRFRLQQFADISLRMYAALLAHDQN